MIFRQPCKARMSEVSLYEEIRILFDKERR